MIIMSFPAFTDRLTAAGDLSSRYGAGERREPPHPGLAGGGGRGRATHPRYYSQTAPKNKKSQKRHRQVDNHVNRH